MLKALPIKDRIVVCKQEEKSLADGHCKKLTNEWLEGLCECNATADNRAAYCAKDDKDGRCNSASPMVIYCLWITMVELILQSIFGLRPW